MFTNELFGCLGKLFLAAVLELQLNDIFIGLAVVARRSALNVCAREDYVLGIARGLALLVGFALLAESEERGFTDFLDSLLRVEGVVVALPRELYDYCICGNVNVNVLVVDILGHKTRFHNGFRGVEVVLGDGVFLGVVLGNAERYVYAAAYVYSPSYIVDSPDVVVLDIAVIGFDAHCAEHGKCDYQEKYDKENGFCDFAFFQEFSLRSYILSCLKDNSTFYYYSTICPNCQGLFTRALKHKNRKNLPEFRNNSPKIRNNILCENISKGLII